jgi:hypothetical protein
MRRKTVTFWLLAALVVVNCAIAAVSYGSERRLMSIEDTLGARPASDGLSARLTQMVNADAVAQPSAGVGATASVNGNDAIGQINIETGADPSSGSLVHIKFITPYPTQPFVMVSPMDQPPPNGWYTTVDQNGFDIWVGTAPKAHTDYPFSYFVASRPWLMYLDGDQTSR